MKSIFVALALSLSALAAPTGKYAETFARMQALQQAHSRSSQLFSIGKNDDGEEIWAMRVSVTPTTVDKKKIGHILVGTHHGNEIGAHDFAMRFLEQLLQRYESPELWKNNLADIEWTIVPVLNISGYNANQREEHNVDPNRDYPSPCSANPGGHLKSIQRLIALVASRPFTGSVTAHGYDGSITYPWGMYSNLRRTLDDNLYATIFANAAKLNNYKSGNGADLIYPANGCYEDYVYWKHGMWSLLLELADGTAPDVEATVPAIFKFYDQLDASPSTHNQFLGKCDPERKGATSWRRE